MSYSKSIWKHIRVALFLAVGLYVAGFAGCQYLRTYRGPWQVTFEPGSSEGSPSIVVHQRHMGVSDLRIVFTNEPPPSLERPKTVLFDEPKEEVPFGEWVFDDLLYLPGTVTLRIYDHEIELLPRTLIIDRREIPWESNKTIVLEPREAPPAAPKPE